MVRSNLVSISVGYSIPLQIILKNTQNVDSPSPFQQMLQFEASEINSVLPSSTPQVAGDFHNIRFKYNYSYIPAWLESISNGVATIWVKLPISIPANSSITIDMEVDPSLNFDGVYWGEAPQLSPTYGEYDNGTSVFNNYWNFAGTSLPSGLNTIIEGGGSVTVNNGVELVPGNSTTGVYSSATLTTPAIVETLTTSDGGTDSAVFFSENDITSMPSSGANINNGYIGGYGGGSQQKIWKDINGGYNNVVSGGSATYPAILSLIWGGTGNLELTFNYGSALTSTDTSFSVGSGWIVGVTSYHGSYVDYQWLRTRAYSPNGVMPSVEVIA